MYLSTKDLALQESISNEDAKHLWRKHYFSGWANPFTWVVLVMLIMAHVGVVVYFSLTYKIDFLSSFGASMSKQIFFYILFAHIISLSTIVSKNIRADLTKLKFRAEKN